MSHLTYRTSRPCSWVQPRQRDPRETTRGKIVPMHKPSLVERLFGRV